MSGASLAGQLAGTSWSVVLAVLPLAMIFLVFQGLFLRLPAREVRRVLAGTLLAATGLFLFLLGVSVAFLPFGRIIGESLGTLPQAWVAVTVGIALGFATAWGEPSVRILAHQVEDATSGSIHRGMVVLAVCAGVGVATGVGMLRIVYGVPLLYLVVPGYALVLALLPFSDREFVAVAIDAGGVATGPLANSFLLALALGVAAGIGGQDPLVQGLGLVALIALAPVISVMALGLLVRRKERMKEASP